MADQMVDLLVVQLVAGSVVRLAVPKDEQMAAASAEWKVDSLVDLSVD